MGLLRLAQPSPEVSPDATVAEAVRVMTQWHVGALSVTDRKKVVGIFTERDLMRRVVAEGRDPASTPIGEVMTSPVQTISGDATAAQAAAVMRARHIRHLAIVDEKGELAGMVALRYLLYEMMDELERKVDSLQGYLMADAPGG